MSFELVDSVLYGEDSKIRDLARAQLIRSGNPKELFEVTKALSASLDTTRRRATRLLSDLQPHRARPVLVRWINIIKKNQWQVTDSNHLKGLKEGVAHAARLLNQLTVRGEQENELFTIYNSNILKAQRATVCPAAPDQLLILALTHHDAKIVESALIESLRRLDQLDEKKEGSKELLTHKLKEQFPRESYPSGQSLEHNILVLWTRLFAYLYPQVSTWSTLSSLIKLNLLALYDDLEGLFNALETAAIEQDDPLILQLLIAIEQNYRHPSRSNEFRIPAPLLETLCQSSSPQVKAIIARLSTHHPVILSQLMNDGDPNVLWCARRASQGFFQREQLHARLGAHQRLNLPSAQPPYGLRAFDDIPQVKRVNGALALCQARFDVNLGVAMRSAEAAGLKEVFVIGARSGSLTSARGAEYAIPIHRLPDAHSLIMAARTKGYQLVAVQQTPDSEPYHTAHYPPQPLFVLGSEDAGLPDPLRVGADLAVEIPLFGVIDSLNVATAATCVIMHWRAHLSLNLNT